MTLLVMRTERLLIHHGKYQLSPHTILTIQEEKAPTKCCVEPNNGSPLGGYYIKWTSDQPLSKHPSFHWNALVLQADQVSECTYISRFLRADLEHEWKFLLSSTKAPCVATSPTTP